MTKKELKQIEDLIRKVVKEEMENSNIVSTGECEDVKVTYLTNDDPYASCCLKYPGSVYNS